MIKAIAFDLDDTLLDTTGILVPRAARDAFEYLIANGLRMPLNECERQRQLLIKDMSHREVFEMLAREHGTPQTVEAVPHANKLFYETDLPPTLPLLDGARANLDTLKTKYKLFLVTAGLQKPQMAKVMSLGIFDDFEKVYVVDSFNKKRKSVIFLEIIRDLKIQNDELLCVGNSILSEIKDAIEIGAKACYFEFGEERGSLAGLTRAPDYHIHQHSQLIPVCQL